MALLTAAAQDPLLLTGSSAGAEEQELIRGPDGGASRSQRAVSAADSFEIFSVAADSSSAVGRLSM
jgi:hypothetical protein